MVKSYHLFLLARCNSDVGLQGSAHVGVLVFSQYIRYCVVADVADVLVVTSHLLHEIVLAGAVDGEVTLDLIAEASIRD